jgi:hypothetical protein
MGSANGLSDDPVDDAEPEQVLRRDLHIGGGVNGAGGRIWTE